MVERYVPEDRLVLTRNPNYWAHDAQGNQLPLLDGIEMIFMDESARVDALRAGQVDYVMALGPASIPLIEADPDTEMILNLSNRHWIIRMRSDVGPASDVRVRQALKAGTDRAELLEGALGGRGALGRDTPIGPFFDVKGYYLDVPPIERDVERAMALLADAGYADGLDITLYVLEMSPANELATIWEQQMAEIGVNVDIQLTPGSVYYGDGLWLEVEFGITEWGPRAHPLMYLNQAYVTGASNNETHWSNARIDELARLIEVEIDPVQRAAYYHEVQEIFMDEGPIIAPFFEDLRWAVRSNVGGIVFRSNYVLDLRFMHFTD